MKKEELFVCLKEIISVAGMEEMVSLSNQKNELADLMLYCTTDGTEYLGSCGEPLFPVSAINNILYQYGDDEDYTFYTFTGTMLQIHFELEGNVDYIYAAGENGTAEALSYPGYWETNGKKICEFLEQYRNRMRAKKSRERMIWTAARLAEYHNVQKDEMDAVKNLANSYIDEHPEDKSFLLYYSYLALTMFWNDEGDGFDVKAALRRIVDRKLEDAYLAYIEDECYCDDDENDNGYYLGVTTTALKIMQEIKEELNKE